MGVTKTYKGRVQNKHKTEAEWLLDVFPNGDKTQQARADAFIPLDGELIIYDPDSVYTYYRFKFGDGERNVYELPFVVESALGDVSLALDNIIAQTQAILGGE